MQAVPLPTPKAKSSKTLVYAGVACVALLAIGALLLSKARRREANSGAASAKSNIEAFSLDATRASEDSGPAGVSKGPLSAQLSGWQPLFTPEEWSAAGKSREFVNGLMHLTRGGAMKPQPTPDGAIRARIRIREGSADGSVRLRMAADGRSYMFSVYASFDTVRLAIKGLSEPDENKLGVHRLPRPLRAGDTITLELHAAGNRLSASVDGKVVIEAMDDRLQGPGQWGVSAADAWFESIEVRPLSAGNAGNLNASEVSDPQAGTETLLVKNATKDAPFVNSLGMKFVPVPIRGGPTSGQRVLFSVWDTRVQDAEAFARETGVDWPKPDYEQGPLHPAVMTSWDDAHAFCAWLTEREHKAGRLAPDLVYRLPTDHEWSCAVGLEEDAALLPSQKNGKINNVFPWGTEWPPSERAGNYWSEELLPLVAAGKETWNTTYKFPGRREGYATTSPVGSFSANPFGLFDMGGNVWQWCEDWYDEKHQDRVMRGAAWPDADRATLLSSMRGHRDQGRRHPVLGFRCVVGPVPTPGDPSPTHTPVPRS
jgi:hypothetical protein